jgi:hypothetical protein
MDLIQEQVVNLRKSIEKALPTGIEGQKVISDALDELLNINATEDLLKVHFRHFWTDEDHRG